MAAAIHFLVTEDPRKLACGSSSGLSTSVQAEVTCKTCLKSIASHAMRAQLEALRQARARAEPPRTTSNRGFFSKIAGVSHSNDDGSSRQRIISRCRVGEPLTLKRDPTNPYDANAIRVHRKNGEQLGYLDRRVASQLARDLDNGTEIPCCISSLTGGGEYTRGVNIYLGEWSEPGVRLNTFTPSDSEQRLPELFL